MLIKVLLFFYCFSSKSILLSLAPFSLEEAIKINFTNKRKHSDSANKGIKKEAFDSEQKSKKSDKKSSQSQKNPEKYPCDACDQKFARVDTLKTHKRTHSGEKTFECDQCDKKFARKADLRSHQRTHSGEKPFPCTECNKRFARVDALGVHKRTHSGEKPYQCDQCNKNFNLLGNLNVHKQTHTGEKPYECDECDKRFSQRSNLKQHKTRDHKKEADLPQEESQAGQEAHSKIIEDPSEWDIDKIAECLDHSDQGALFPFEDRDKKEPNLPQEESQAEQEAHSKIMEYPSELSCWFCISDRTYTTNSNLNQHIRKQHDYYKCKYKDCDKSFILGSLLFQHIEKQHGFPSLPCSKCPQSFHGLLNLYQHKYINHKKYDKNTFLEFIKDFIIKNLRCSYPSDGQHPFFNSLFSKEEVLRNSLLLDLDIAISEFARPIDESSRPIETLLLYNQFIEKITSKKCLPLKELSLDELLSYECYRLYLSDDSAIGILFLKEILSIMIQIKNSLKNSLKNLLGNPVETTYKEMLDRLYTNQFSDEEYSLFMQTFENLFFRQKISLSEQIKIIRLNSLNKSA